MSAFGKRPCQRPITQFGQPYDFRLSLYLPLDNVSVLYTIQLVTQKYFRLQIGSYTLSQMQAHASADGGDDCGEQGGVCATGSVNELSRNTVYELITEPTAEVVVLNGNRITEIYDGVRIEPTTIVARFSGAQWMAMVADGSAYDYEN